VDLDDPKASSAPAPPDSRVITMAADSCLVELVGDRCRPVPPGVPSAKVLVATLYNTALPLIR
jgi:phenylacetate-CoA ligase